MFNQTIRENILNGLPDQKNANDNDELIKKTLNIANADFVNKMENGLDTNVGNLGSQLSGG